MIRLNLLPPPCGRMLEIMHTGRNGFFGLILVLVVSAAMGWWYWALLKHRAELTARTSVHQRTTRDADSIHRQIEQWELEVRQLRETLFALEKLQANRNQTVGMLDVVSSSLPTQPSVWLTQLLQDRQTLTVRGRSLGVSGINDFMAELSRSGAFASVELDYWTQEEQSYEFGLTCLLSLSEVLSEDFQ